MGEVLSQMIDKALEAGVIAPEKQEKTDALETELATLNGGRRPNLRLAKMDEQIAKLKTQLNIA